jgi:ArsR family transcriptional regulator
MKLSKMNQANVSQHLCLLKEEDIVRTRRDGVKIYYSLATPKMIEAFDIMREILLDKIAKTEKLSRDVRRARKERT